MASNKDLLDPDLLRLLSGQSADAIDWLIKLGVEMPPDLLYYSGLEEQYKSVTEPVKRGHCAKGKGGGLMKVLVSAVSDRKIEVLYRTAAESLFVDKNGGVIGAKAKGTGGNIHIRAKRGVVLGSGGFARNKEMVKSYFPLQISAVPVVAPGLTGDGILMAGKIGAPIVDTGTVELPPSLPALEVVPGEKAIMFSSAYFLYKYPAIFVNETGKRFCNETAYYQVVSPQILKEKSAYVIFDERVREEGGGGIGFGFSSDLSTEIKNGWLKQAPTIGELAKDMGIDPSAVEETVLQFNKNIKEGKDPAFGRSKAMGTIDFPPFCGGKLTVTVVESFGGLRVNTKAEVMDTHNKPIPGLYAGGAVAATMRAYAGSGAFLNTCFVLGRLAGKNCATAKA
jgi:fumarate reductase flavoprotein subunit